jgi:UDP-N-acetylglucosamine 2-epimerase (non-hydrolysing)
MKIKPVVDALESAEHEVLLVHTGQHYDASMSDVFFEDIGLRVPDCHLEAGSGTHAEQTARVMLAFEPLVKRTTPDVVVVVGDVNSTVACALVAAKAGALVAHVEAGLRSRDWQMPEEINRVVTDRLSDFLFAHSQDAVDNLRSEGYRDDQIYLVGNVMIDTLLANLDRARQRPILQTVGLRNREYGLVTLHRPSNVDDPAMLHQLLETLGIIARDCPLVFPVHPRTRALIDDIPAPANVTFIAPAGYLDFIALEAGARVVLTDSGGVQEETTVLGVPCLTLRESTERPITVREGTNIVVGRDPARIVAEARRALDSEVTRRPPALWDGLAGARIADVLSARWRQARDTRPTAVV